MLITYLISYNGLYNFLINNSLFVLMFVVCCVGVYQWRFKCRYYDDEKAISEAYFLGKWGRTK